MEVRKRNIMINKAGGNAGADSKNYRVSLPAEWVRELGVTEDDREVLIIFDEKKIIIGGKEMEEFRGNIKCPECGALIPQYIKYCDGTWDTRETCDCGYHRDYDPSKPHGN